MSTSIGLVIVQCSPWSPCSLSISYGTGRGLVQNTCQLMGRMLRERYDANTMMSVVCLCHLVDPRNIPCGSAAAKPSPSPSSKIVTETNFVLPSLAGRDPKVESSGRNGNGRPPSLALPIPAVLRQVALPLPHRTFLALSHQRPSTTTTRWLQVHLHHPDLSATQHRTPRRAPPNTEHCASHQHSRAGCSYNTAKQ